MEGIVKWFNNKRGYGFIEQEDGRDIFVHYSSVVGDGYRTLKKGDKVKFNSLQTDKGYQAQEVIVCLKEK